MSSEKDPRFYIFRVEFYVFDYGDSNITDADIARAMLRLNAGKGMFGLFCKMPLRGANTYLSRWKRAESRTGMHLEPVDYTAWSEIDRDMSELSGLFPDTTFAVHCEAVERENDVREKYYRNGEIFS